MRGTGVPPRWDSSDRRGRWRNAPTASLDGWRLIDRGGAWIGNVEQLCAGERGDGLERAVVSTGLVGLRRIVVPLDGATPVAVAAPFALGSP
jgi:hypothetical protein